MINAHIKIYVIYYFLPLLKKILVFLYFSTKIKAGCKAILQKHNMEKQAFDMQKAWQEENRQKLISKIRERHFAVAQLEIACGKYKTPMKIRDYKESIPQKYYPPKKINSTINKIRAVTRIEYHKNQNLSNYHQFYNNLTTNLPLNQRSRRVNMAHIEKLGKTREKYESRNKFANSDFRGMILADYANQARSNTSYASYFSVSPKPNIPSPSQPPNRETLLSKLRERIKRREMIKNNEKQKNVNDSKEKSDIEVFLI